jgi:hypothetical protein
MKRKKMGKVSKGQKKPAKRTADNIEFSNEEDEPPKRFTVLFNIEGLKSATATNFHSKTALPPLVIKKGPFIIQMIPSLHSKILLLP